MRLVMACLMALALGGPAFAGKPDVDVGAERYRLELELDRHAGSTRWKGVERTYAKLAALQIPLTTRAHYTAAIAAENQGDVLSTWKRLERAIRHKNALQDEDDGDGEGFRWGATVPAEIDFSDDATQQAVTLYNSLTERYGRVTIQVGKGRLPALVRLGAKPFGATERGAIARGQEELASSQRFSGLLPIGSYMVDGERFAVVAGDLTVVRVKSAP